jgi:hypothetical protein
MAKSKAKKLQWKFLKVNGEMYRQYKVSNEGEIFDVKNGVLLTQYDMYKKSPFNGTDYKRVYVPALGKQIRVHRAVCETFHGAAPAGQNVVLHLDERKDNNNKDNLQWGTPAQNTQDWILSRGGIVPRYTLAKIRRVKRLLNKGHTNDTVAQMTKISDSTVSLIKLGRSHRNVEPLTAQQIALGNV